MEAVKARRCNEQQSRYDVTVYSVLLDGAGTQSGQNGCDESLSARRGYCMQLANVQRPNMRISIAVNAVDGSGADQC